VLSGVVSSTESCLLFTDHLWFGIPFSFCRVKCNIASVCPPASVRFTEALWGSLFVILVKPWSCSMDGRDRDLGLTLFVPWMVLQHDGQEYVRLISISYECLALSYKLEQEEKT